MKKKCEDDERGNDSCRQTCNRLGEDKAKVKAGRAE